MNIKITLNDQSNKYNRGQVLVDGSNTMPGASIFAIKAAERMGIGITVLLVNEKYDSLYNTRLLNQVIQTYSNDLGYTKILRKRSSKAKTTLVIGPGYDKDENFILKSLANPFKAIILDGPALKVTSLAVLKKAIAKISTPVIITPHWGEFSSFFASTISLDKSKEVICKEAAKQLGAIVLLKGKDSVLSDGKKIKINSHASNVLATAGSGDILSGMIAGLCALDLDDYAIMDIVYMATWLHGETGFWCQQEFGVSTVASDLLAVLPKVIKKHLNF